MSFLSMGSLSLSPGPSRKSSPSDLQTNQSPLTKDPRTDNLSRSPGPARTKKFFRKPTFFSKLKTTVISDDEECEIPHAPGSTYLGQIYRNARLKLSRSITSTSSSQVDAKKYCMIKLSLAKFIS